jgi:hypothetical protein
MDAHQILSVAFLGYRLSNLLILILLALLVAAKDINRKTLLAASSTE